MEISEEKLKKDYDNYVEEKTKILSGIIAIVGILIIIISAVFFIFLGISIDTPTTAIVLFIIWLICAKITDIIVSFLVKINQKAMCLSYEKWSLQYLQRGNLMQSYNQSESTFGNKNTYDSEILPYTIRAKISELQNQIDANFIINRNLPMFEMLLQQKVLVTAQKQLVELEIQKIPLYQQARENQVFMALMAQKNDKQRNIENIESQLNRLQ